MKCYLHDGCMGFIATQFWAFQHILCICQAAQRSFWTGGGDTLIRVLAMGLHSIYERGAFPVHCMSSETCRVTASQLQG